MRRTTSEQGAEQAMFDQPLLALSPLLLSQNMERIPPCVVLTRQMGVLLFPPQPLPPRGSYLYLLQTLTPKQLLSLPTIMRPVHNKAPAQIPERVILFLGRMGPTLLSNLPTLIMGP